MIKRTAAPVSQCALSFFATPCPVLLPRAVDRSVCSDGKAKGLDLADVVLQPAAGIQMTHQESRVTSSSTEPRLFQ
jgi:hypothetical protein